MSSYNEDIEIAMKIYEQTYSNFRHWDQIRWLVPYWFITVSTALGAAIFKYRSDQDVLRMSGSLIFVFSFLCLVLMYNTIRYHNKSIENFYEKMDALGITKNNRLNFSIPFCLLSSKGRIYFLRQQHISCSLFSSQG